MKKSLFLSFFPFVLFQPILCAFTPYENFLLSDESRRVGLIALADEDIVNSMAESTFQIGSDARKQLKAAGVENLHVFTRQIGAQGFVFAYFEWDSTCKESLTTVLNGNCAEVAQLEKKLTPHPRAAKGEIWLPMEWMNCIATTKAFPHKSKKVQKMALMSGLKPEKELDYRSLHQTNWPGVVDGMVMCNYRNWTTFIVELESELYLFTYFEYIGENIAADNALMASDPVTNRWWAHTEPCLINLAGEGNWSSMKSLLP